MKSFLAFSTVFFFAIPTTAQAGGTLTGTVTFEGKAPVRKELNITQNEEICGKEKHYDESLLVAENNGLQNVLVSIVNAPEGKNLNAFGTDISLHQIGCVYTPHIQLVPVGVPVKIFNDDGILHNIHTHSKKNRSFNVAQPKFIKKIEKTFKKAPEIVSITCDIHGWMSGYLVIVDHPYYAITDESGEYTIGGLSPGTYQLEFWHEKLGKQTKEITLTDDGEVEVDAQFAMK